MLPSRAYSDSADTTRLATPAAEPRPVLVVAVSASDVEQFSTNRFTRIVAHSTLEAISALERTRPRVVATDLDAPELDAAAICAAARQTGCTSILVTTGTPERVPAALKAGCHAVLLKPFAPVILASRLGRLLRGPIPVTLSRRATKMPPQPGSNRRWPDVTCAKCDHGGAVSFEFSSYRRMWYACLACEAVWLGPRRE